MFPCATPPLSLKDYCPSTVIQIPLILSSAPSASRGVGGRASSMGTAGRRQPHCGGASRDSAPGNLLPPSICEGGSQIQCSRGSAWAGARERREPPRSRVGARAGSSAKGDKAGRGGEVAMLAKRYRLKLATWTVVREPGQPSPRRR
jgi:hypothetical protein